MAAAASPMPATHQFHQLDERAANSLRPVPTEHSLVMIRSRLRRRQGGRERPLERLEPSGVIIVGETSRRRRPSALRSPKAVLRAWAAPDYDPACTTTTSGSSDVELLHRWRAWESSGPPPPRGPARRGRNQSRSPPCMLATGATQRRLDIPRDQRSTASPLPPPIDKLHRLDQAVRVSSRVAVIGAGWIR